MWTCLKPRRKFANGLNLCLEPELGGTRWFCVGIVGVTVRDRAVNKTLQKWGGVPDFGP